MIATLDGIELPEDLLWEDEWTGWKVGQVIRPTLTGAITVQESALQAGRPITLRTLELGAGVFVAPVSLTVLEALQAKEQVAGASPMSLVLPGSGGVDRTFSVIWRRTDGAGIDARPLIFRVPAEPADLYSITLRLIQV